MGRTLESVGQKTPQTSVILPGNRRGTLGRFQTLGLSWSLLGQLGAERHPQLDGHGVPTEYANPCLKRLILDLEYVQQFEGAHVLEPVADVDDHLLLSSRQGCLWWVVAVQQQRGGGAATLPLLLPPSVLLPPLLLAAGWLRRETWPAVTGSVWSP